MLKTADVPEESVPGFEHPGNTIQKQPGREINTQTIRQLSTESPCTDAIVNGLGSPQDESQPNKHISSFAEEYDDPVGVSEINSLT